MQKQNDRFRMSGKAQPFQQTYLHTPLHHNAFYAHMLKSNIWEMQSATLVN